MYIKQDIENVNETRSQHGNKHTTVYRFPVSMSDYQQEFTDLNTVCDVVKQMEPSGVHFHEVNANWMKNMNYKTYMMDKVLDVRIVSDGELSSVCVEDMMRKLEDHIQEHMKGYSDWKRDEEGPKPSHACVYYEKENDLKKDSISLPANHDDFTAAVESIPTDDKGLNK